MAKVEDVRALEDSCPWLRDDFRAGLALLSDDAAEESRRYAARMRVVAALAAQVPRCAMDERGATPWTSFRREVAVALKVSDIAAAAEIRAAVRLTEVLRRTMELLEAGTMPAPRARAFVTELQSYDDELAAQLDADLAEQAAALPTWRTVQAVRRAAAVLDPDAAAARTARKNDERGVLFSPDKDDQAAVVVFGPAVPLTRWYGSLDERARALKAAGDGRSLDNLRFDLATSQLPCATHAPADPTKAAAGEVSTIGGTEPDAPTDSRSCNGSSGLRDAFVEAASTDCRLSRPVQAQVVVPVETTLGLSNEPGWLVGYGWLSAPTTRALLVDAELRRVCSQVGTGVLVDVASRAVRPPPDPDGLRAALVGFVLDDITVSDLGWRSEPQHDPSDSLREFVTLRDRACDGPTGSRVPAARSDLDHDEPYPAGPTAAWNLAARGRRTHQLKHYGWTPVRTAASTVWLSPAGQVVEVPRHVNPPPGVDADPDRSPVLPDPHHLAATDRAQLTAPADDDGPPWLPTGERGDRTEWTMIDDGSDAPF